MNEGILRIPEKELYKEAQEHFIHICGLSRESSKQLKMLNLGTRSRLKGLEGLNIKAIIKSFDIEAYQNRKVQIQGKTFTCHGFENIPDDTVKKVYLYIVTVGECKYDQEDDIMTQLYADVWGTAYTEAARDYVKNRILEDLSRGFPGQPGNSLFLSETFGPGFYGMDVLKSIDLYGLLEAEKIGIQVRDSGILLPLKSCSGIFLAVTDPNSLPHPDCRDCLGNAMSCSFCRLRKHKN